MFDSEGYCLITNGICEKPDEVCMRVGISGSCGGRYSSCTYEYVVESYRRRVNVENRENQKD